MPYSDGSWGRKGKLRSKKRLEYFREHHKEKYKNDVKVKNKIKKEIEKYQKKYPEREIARLLLRIAVKKGKIIKPNKCSRCNGIGRIQGHHEDYFKPLEAIWLCTSCHRKLHNSKTEKR